MAEKKRRVEFTFPWTDPDGTEYETGDEAWLADLQARRLIHGGRAREVPLDPQETAEAAPAAAVTHQASPALIAPAATAQPAPDRVVAAPADSAAEVEPPTPPAPLVATPSTPKKGR